MLLALLSSVIYVHKGQCSHTTSKGDRRQLKGTEFFILLSGNLSFISNLLVNILTQHIKIVSMETDHV